VGCGSGAGSKTFLFELVLQILPLLTRMVTHAGDLVAFTMARYRVDTAAPASCELENVDVVAWSPTTVQRNVKSGVNQEWLL